MTYSRVSPNVASMSWIQVFGDIIAENHSIFFEITMVACKSIFSKLKSTPCTPSHYRFLSAVIIFSFFILNFNFLKLTKKRSHMIKKYLTPTRHSLERLN